MARRVAGKYVVAAIIGAAVLFVGGLFVWAYALTPAAERFHNRGLPTARR